MFVIGKIFQKFVCSVRAGGDTMRFGIHNLLREKIEQFSDDEENIEVEETDNEEHEEEEEEDIEEEEELDKRVEEAGSDRLIESTKRSLHEEEVNKAFFKIILFIHSIYST